MPHQHYQIAIMSKNKYISHISKRKRKRQGTSRSNGGYLPSPGVALAEAETMSASTR